MGRESARWKSSGAPDKLTSDNDQTSHLVVGSARTAQERDHPVSNVLSAIAVVEDVGP